LVENGRIVKGTRLSLARIENSFSLASVLTVYQPAKPEDSKHKPLLHVRSRLGIEDKGIRRPLRRLLFLLLILFLLLSRLHFNRVRSEIDVATFAHISPLRFPERFRYSQR